MVLWEASDRVCGKLRTHGVGVNRATRLRHARDEVDLGHVKPTVRLEDARQTQKTLAAKAGPAAATRCPPLTTSGLGSPFDLRSQ